MSSLKTVPVPYLDGWRGLAIFLVLQSHFLFGGAGRLGVALFFALSGYLMGNLLFVKRVRLTDFFARRFSRVIPTFWIFTIAMLVYASTMQPRRYVVGASELIDTLFFLRTYLPAGASIWSDKWPIGHFWSLNVEEHSYVYLAIGGLVLRWLKKEKASHYFLLASCVCMIATICWYSVSPPAGKSPWFARSECAALGLFAAAGIKAWLGNSIQRIPVLAHPVVPLMTFLAGAACFTINSDAAVLIVGPLLLAVAINYVDCLPKTVHRLLSLRPLRWLGLASFSLYLWQQPFYLAYTQFGLQRQLAGVLALLVGAASYYFLEDPARRYLNARWNDVRRPGSAEGQVLASEEKSLRSEEIPLP